MSDTKAEILRCAKDLFSAEGYKNTNITDITKAAHIGTGTFYNYYKSKDELFLEIYFIENEALKKQLMASVDFNEDPITLVQNIIAKNLAGMKANPILKEWYNRDLFSKLEKAFYQKGGMKNISELMNGGLLEMIRTWKAQGNLRKDIDDEMIAAIFNAIPYIDVHKEEIGIQFFPKILEYMEEFIMQGLTPRPEK